MKRNLVVCEKTEDGYKEVGVDFEGWPANGLWYVSDGSQSLLTKADFDLIPPFLPALMTQTEKCTEHIMMKIEEQKKYSYNDCAKWAAEFYAGLITKEEYPEAFV